MKTKIRKLIVRQTGIKVEKVTDGAALVDDLYVDSLDRVELTMTFEDEFGVEIPDEDAEAWKTVGDIISYLTDKHA